MSREEPECRICRGGAEADEPLFRPCRCSGSIEFVHQTCLEEWLSFRGRSALPNCEVCGTPYAFKRIYKSDTPSSLAAHKVLLKALQKLCPRPFAVVSSVLQLLVFTLAVSFVSQLMDLDSKTSVVTFLRQRWRDWGLWELFVDIWLGLEALLYVYVVSRLLQFLYLQLQRPAREANEAENGGGQENDGVGPLEDEEGDLEGENREGDQLDVLAWQDGGVQLAMNLLGIFPLIAALLVALKWVPLQLGRWVFEQVLQTPAVVRFATGVIDVEQLHLWVGLGTIGTLSIVLGVATLALRLVMDRGMQIAFVRGILAGIIGLARMLRSVFLLFLDVFVLPWTLGWLAVILTLPLLDGTLYDRLVFFWEAPFISSVMHWAVGFGLSLLISTVMHEVRGCFNPQVAQRYHGILGGQGPADEARPFARGIDGDLVDIRMPQPRTVLDTLKRVLSTVVVYGVVLWVGVAIPLQIGHLMMPWTWWNIAQEGDTAADEGGRPSVLEFSGVIDTQLVDVQLPMELLMFHVVLPLLSERLAARAFLRQVARFIVKHVAALLDSESLLDPDVRDGHLQPRNNGRPNDHVQVNGVNVALNDDRQQEAGRPQQGASMVVLGATLVLSLFLGGTLVIHVPLFVGRALLPMLGVGAQYDVYNYVAGVLICWTTAAVLKDGVHVPPQDIPPNQNPEALPLLANLPEQVQPAVEARVEEEPVNVAPEVDDHTDTNTAVVNLAACDNLLRGVGSAQGTETLGLGEEDREDEDEDEDGETKEGEARNSVSLAALLKRGRSRSSEDVPQSPALEPESSSRRTPSSSQRRKSFFRPAFRTSRRDVSEPEEAFGPPEEKEAQDNKTSTPSRTWTRFQLALQKLRSPTKVAQEREGEERKEVEAPIVEDVVQGEICAVEDMITEESDNEGVLVTDQAAVTPAPSPEDDNDDADETAETAKEFYALLFLKTMGEGVCAGFLLGAKWAIILAIWLGVIPLGLGLMGEAYGAIPIRSALTELPLVPLMQVWAMGLVFLKIWARCVLLAARAIEVQGQELPGRGADGVAPEDPAAEGDFEAGAFFPWEGDGPFMAQREILRWNDRFRRVLNDGVMGLDFTFAMRFIIWPICRQIFRALCMPFLLGYLAEKTLHTVFPMHIRVFLFARALRRFSYHLYAGYFIGLRLHDFLARLYRRLHDQLIDEEYLVGKQLVNFGEQVEDEAPGESASDSLPVPPPLDDEVARDGGALDGEHLAAPEPVVG